MVKCVKCGFLALRRWPSRTLVEADGEYRETASLPGVSEVKEYYEFPFCFARKECLENCGDEARMIAGYRGHNRVCSKDILTIIKRDILCDGFTKWYQGFTPKEHMEMKDSEEWRKWQVEESKKNRKWHVIEAVVFAGIAGMFILLGAVIS